MTKIEAVTTFMNAGEIGGTATPGNTYEVSDSYAKELVEEKGYATYTNEKDGLDELESEYSKEFVNANIEENFPNFPHLENIKASGMETFRDVLEVRDRLPQNINGVGSAYAKNIKEAIDEAFEHFEE